MRSIGGRITVWYATAATVTLACVFVVGYHYLERHLIHGVDLLLETEFKQIRSHLGPEFQTMSAPFRELRVRELTENANALFFIEIRLPDGGVLRSSNLNERDNPELPQDSARTGSAIAPDELRSAVFDMPPFQVAISTSLLPVREVMVNYVRVCVALTLSMLLISFAIGFGLSRMILQPVRLIRDTADRIRSDNLEQRIPVSNVHDEISDLARLLNQMFDRLEDSFKQIRRFTAEASHELKTPLTLVRLHAERLIGDPSLAATHRESVLVQLDEIARLNRLIEDLLFLSRADAHAIELHTDQHDPAEFLQGFAQDAVVLAEHHDLKFEYLHSGHQPACFEPRSLRQVLLNLLTNAINVSPPGASIRLLSACVDADWQIEFEDEGPGLPAEQRERIFERFFRYSSTGWASGGSGLGLAICRSIVELHGGRIAAQERPGLSGLKVVIRLPLTGPPA